MRTTVGQVRRRWCRPGSIGTSLHLYPCGYVPGRLHSRHGCGTAGTGGPQPTHDAGDPSRPSGVGRRAGRRAADRPSGRLPAPARAAGGRAGRRTTGGAAADLQPAAGTPHGRGRVARATTARCGGTDSTHCTPRSLGERGSHEHHRDDASDWTRPVERCASRTCTTPRSRTCGRRARHRSGSRAGWPRSTGDLRVGGAIQVGVHQHLDRPGTDRGVRCAAPSAPHPAARLRGRGRAGGMADRGGRGPDSSSRNAGCRGASLDLHGAGWQAHLEDLADRWHPARGSPRGVVLVQAHARVGTALGRAVSGLSRHDAQRGVSDHEESRRLSGADPGLRPGRGSGARAQAGP